MRMGNTLMPSRIWNNHIAQNRKQSDLLPEDALQKLDISHLNQ